MALSFSRPTSKGLEACEVSHTALSRTWNCEASDMALSPSEMTRTMRCLLQGMPKLEHSRVHSPMAAMRRRHLLQAGSVGEAQHLLYVPAGHMGLRRCGAAHDTLATPLQPIDAGTYMQGSQPWATVIVAEDSGSAKRMCKAKAGVRCCYGTLAADVGSHSTTQGMQHMAAGI